MSDVDKRYSITGAAALRILNRVFEQANAGGKAIFVAVVDGTGALVGLLAHEKVPAICRQICQDKAFTAYATKMKTSAWKAYVYSTPQEERDLMLRQPGYIAASGGCPIIIDGVVAGAVGVSGAGQQEDEDLAALGAALISAD
jgi:glc operon protein GlcG